MTESTTAPILPPTLPDLLSRAIAAEGSAPFLGVRSSTAREQSLTFEEFGLAGGPGRSAFRTRRGLATVCPPGGMM